MTKEVFTSEVYTTTSAFLTFKGLLSISDAILKYQLYLQSYYHFSLSIFQILWILMQVALISFLIMPLTFNLTVTYLSCLFPKNLSLNFLCTTEKETSSCCTGNMLWLILSHNFLIVADLSDCIFCIDTEFKCELCW